MARLGDCQLSRNDVSQLFELDTGLPESSARKSTSSYCTVQKDDVDFLAELSSDSLWQSESFRVSFSLPVFMCVAVSELPPPLDRGDFVLPGTAPVVSPFD